jgi:LmbE family N-acetylglucosaminyl deacetylase
MSPIVISPHLDDAVLSVGQWLATQDDVQVVTVFAGAPPDPQYLGDYDRLHGGATSSRAAMLERQAEDRAACALLGVEPVHLGFYDCQYNARYNNHEAEIVEMLARLCAGASHVLAPLGVGHPDHLLLSRLAREACTTRTSMWLYEDLPNVPLARQEQVDEARDAITYQGWSGAERILLAGDDDESLWRKVRALGCYRSQIDGITTTMLTAEAVWEISR